MGTYQDGKQDRPRGEKQTGLQTDCRVVVGPEEAAAARSAWPDAPIVALVDASDPAQAVFARCAGADVVVPTADLAAGWRQDTPALELAVTAASSLATRRAGLRESSRRSAHDLGQSLSAINLATELAIGEDDKNDRLLQEIRTQVLDAGVHTWRAGRVGRSSPSAFGPVDLSSLLHGVAMSEPDVSVYDSTGSVWVLGNEQRLEQVLEELVQLGRGSAANQRIDVRCGADGTVDITVRGLGSPRRGRSHTDGEFGLMAVAEIVNDMGGQLRISGDGAVGPLVVGLSLPLLPAGGVQPGLVEVPPDRMAIQTAILEGVLRHAPLSESLEAIVAAIEQQLPGTICSVLLLNEQRCLNHAAGAGLPDAYREEIDGVAIGLGQGSCGTAAFLGRPVVAADVATDPLWTDFREFALAHELRSCWSTPILAADGGEVLGTFAVYRPEVWEPNDSASRLVSRFTYLAAVAIGHHRLFRAVAKSESRFRGAFEGATAGMALVALDGSFQMVNPALCAMLDNDPDGLEGRNLLDLVDPAHRSIVTDCWADLLDDPTSNRPDRETTEVAIVTAAGRESLWVSLRSSLVTTDETSQPYLYVEIRDITATRRHAAERRAREAAEAASQAKSDLLALVSHELRTPLNAILGFAQIMKLIDLDRAQRGESLENIIKAGQHLLELINELLDLSLLESGQRSTLFEDLDADEVIDGALQILQPLADSRRISLYRGLGTKLTRSSLVHGSEIADRRAVLRANRQSLRQVLINLVGNAVKFTPPGGEVGIAVCGRTEDTVRINVVDSGPGIPAEAIESLFQPFHRLAPRADSETEGTGLGLSVAARLVEEMQGTIGVQSKLGIGSCFWVDLPGSLEATACDPGSDHRSEPLGPVAVADHPTTGTVLYVEDDPACIDVMNAAMALRPGITLLTAGSMKSGIALIRSQNVDAILVDIGLPDGSGWELLRVIREEAEIAPIPAVVLTAGHGLVPSGAPDPEHVMTKPLDIAACIETLDELLAV